MGIIVYVKARLLDRWLFQVNLQCRSDCGNGHVCELESDLHE